VNLISEGQKVNQSQAALLDKLKIRPFEYKMHVKRVLDNGKIYPPSVLNIKSDDILASFKNAGTNLTALSLGSGYIVPSAAPHLIFNAFKNLACVSFAVDYSFPLAERLKGSGAPVASAAATTATAAKVETKEEKKKEEEPEEEVEMGDFFGDGY